VKIGDTNLPVGNFKMQGEKLYRNGTIAPNAELIRQGVPPPLPPREPAAPTTPSAGLHKYDDLAAPQPPPAPAPTISMGETKSQVIAAFGEPQRKAAVGPKEVFFYIDLKMKVTLTNGKVSSIE